MITEDWTAEQKELFIAMVHDILEMSDLSSFFRHEIDKATTLDDLEWMISHAQAAQELGCLAEEEALSLIVSAQLREIVR